MTYYDIIGRTLVTFFVLFIMIKLAGKKQISELTFFNYVTGITIGAIAAYTCLSNRITLLEGISSLAVWVGLTILFGYVSLKTSKGRVLLQGEPTIVIRNGQILKDALTSLRLTIDDLSMLLRREKIFDFSKVAYAIVELNGKLSVLEKPEQQIVTLKDMKIPAPALKYFPTQIISEGKVIEDNIKNINLDQAWLIREIKSQGYNKIEDIFYAQIQRNGSLYIVSQ